MPDAAGVRPDGAACLPPEPRSRVPARRGDLFAYGTLQFPQVLNALLDRVPDYRPAWLAGWRAARLRGLSYPGLVPGGAASGVLLTGLSDAEWRILDAYEDREYDLIAVLLADTATALTYRYTANELVTAQDWSADDFARCHLPGFVRYCHYWRLKQAF